MPWIEDARTDVQYAIRQMRAAPVFAVMAIATLALGIGANTAIFSVVNAVLVRPLPYKEADRLVHIVQRMGGSGAPADAAASVPAGLDAAQFAAFRAQTRTLSHVATHGMTTMTLSHEGTTVMLDGAHVSPEVFEMMGAPLRLGRVFGADDASSSSTVVILSDATWRRYFAADPHIIGRGVTLNGEARSVVGVMSPRFAFPDALTDFWIPYVSPAATAGMRPPRLPVLGRVKEGVTKAAAAAEVNAILQGLAVGNVLPPVAPGAAASGAGSSRGAGTSETAPGFGLFGFEEHLTAPIKPALLVLSTAVAFLLLIACVNVANLLLARTSTREQEIATRLAIGASRARLIRQWLTESVTLSLIGGIVGIGLALGGIQLLRILGTTMARRDLGANLSIPRLDEVGIDGSVLAFTFAMSLVTGVLFGVAPALRQSRVQLAGTLREGSGSAGTRGRTRIQGILVVAEVAMALLLFVGGGLLTRSFVKLSRVDPGYDASNVLTFQLRAPIERGLIETADRLVERLSSLPQVRAAGYTRQLPMVRARSMVPLRTTSELPGDAAPPPAPSGMVNPPQWPDTRHISHDYLDAMRIRVVSGRGFTAGDEGGQPQVLLINDALARSGILGPHPVGTSVYALGIAPWEVVGIVDDVRQAGLDEDPGPQVFLDVRQLPGAARLTGPVYFVVRTDADAVAIAPTLRSMVQEIDPLITVDGVATMEQLVANSIARPRIYAALIGIFAGVAVILAAVGIYGVVSYGVAQRTREIGIRMALGAQTTDVIRLMLAQSGMLIGFGIVAGLAAAPLVTRYLRSLLFGLTPLDPLTFAGVTLALAGVAMLAAYVPARRVTEVDPVVAIRAQ
jgi:putative ABC transport system permease protein